MEISDFVINNKDRIAQMILMPVNKMDLEEVEILPDWNFKRKRWIWFNW